MRCGGREAREGIRKFPQIAWPAASPAQGGGAAQLGGQLASWHMGLDLGKLGKGQK